MHLFVLTDCNLVARLFITFIPLHFLHYAIEIRTPVQVIHYISLYFLRCTAATACATSPMAERNYHSKNTKFLLSKSNFSLRTYQSYLRYNHAMHTMHMASMYIYIYIYMLPARIVNDFYKRNQLLNCRYGLNEKYRVAHSRLVHFETRYFTQERDKIKWTSFRLKTSSLLLIYYF